MELRHIRCFLESAEDGNVIRAAARLGVRRPPLGPQIEDLEAEVGARLFHRLPYGGEPTDAGRAFRDAVAAIPGRAGDALRLALGFTGAAAIIPASG